MSSPPPPPPSIPSLSNLQARCAKLLEELSEYEAYLAKERHVDTEVKALRKSVTSDVKVLSRLDGQASTVPEIQRAKLLQSSNVPFYEAVWATAKRCEGVVAFSRRFHCSSPSGGSSAESARNQIASRGKKRSTFVDIVADNGLRWIKVSAVTETRLLFELAKQGWELEDSSDEGVGHHNDTDYVKEISDDDDEGAISILRIARDLLAAARAHRVKYRHPKVTLVLPRLQQSTVKQIDQIINEVRATGVELILGLPAFSMPGVFESREDETGDGRILDVPISNVLSRLAPASRFPHSSVLNIDCTLLLALTSDLSHFMNPEADAAHHTATRRQIEHEAEEALLPNVLYPVMQDCELTCTEEAACRMREIVDSVGTESEKARGALLLSALTNECAKDQLAQLSDHEVPKTLRLPIRVVQSAAHTFDKTLHIVRKLGNHLSEINRSVFLHGWASNITTLTSNRSVAKQIVAIIVEDLDAAEEVGQSVSDDQQERISFGPDIWVCDVARSLIGKDKCRREG
ncbi:MAG: hypothetical protein M1828_006022 [Chrysothrix sp. TS-e1954]|nr:MAG: hypothetical protein M1828_006022 [Chrysothrix sp. TS-e1954]